MKTLTKKEEGQILKNLILQNIQELSGGQWFYSVIHYGDYGDDGLLRTWNDRRGLYREEHIRKNHRRIKTTLKEYWGKDILTYFTLERHQDIQEVITTGGPIQYGDTKRNKFHTNLIVGPISDEVLENPNSKLQRLWESPGRMGIPISQLTYNPYDLTDLKIDLLNSTIRLHPDVNNYSHSVKTQLLETSEDIWEVFDYSLKDITRKGLDFMEVLDIENSDT